MEFIDLRTQYELSHKAILERIKHVLEHGKFIMGPEIEELERTLSEYTGKRHAISCSSGTDALLMPLMAREIGHGDAVFTTPFTFFATAEMISLVGATPIFVDVVPETFNINPEQLRLAIRAVRENDSTIYPLPRLNQPLNCAAVIAVDIFGVPANYESIAAICRKEGLFLIEDAAQSFGAKYRGRPACCFGDVSTTSFFPAKPLGCYGDGGMVFTDDEALAAAMLSIRIHGKGEDKYDNVRIGLNARMDTLQAAILLAKWPQFEGELQLRQQVADRYAELFTAVGLSKVLPRVPKDCLSAWAQYTVRVPGKRDSVQQKLKSQGIPTAVYYPKPLHLLSAYSGLEYKPDDFPVSEQACHEVMSLPSGPYLRIEDQQHLVSAFASVM